MNIAGIVQRVEQVEKRRRDKVQKFLELLRDPDLAPYVALFQNGHHPESAHSLVREQVKHPVRHVASTAPSGLRQTVRHLELPERFISDDVVNGLQKRNFDFKKRNPKRAVVDLLYAMSHGKNPELKILEQGGGGKRSVYTRIK